MAASLKVYGWRKPTLTVELVEGGSYLANTKYYVMGLYSFCPYTYCAIGGELSDIHEITTTSTARSIKITQTTYRDITNFADNGDSRTLVTCPMHCFADEDEVIIGSGSYAGTYDLERVDYDSFIIDIAYVDNIATSDCYSSTAQYNIPDYNSGRNNASGMVYWIDTVHPIHANGYYINTDRYTKRPYTTTNLENPLTMTAPSNNRYGDYVQHPELSNLENGSAKACKEYGTILVDWESGSGTLEDVYDEVMAAGYTYNCGYSANSGSSNAEYFELVGSLRAKDDASFTANGYGVTIWGEFRQVTNPTNFVFNGCSLLFPISFFTAYFDFEANDCVIYNLSLIHI